MSDLLDMRIARLTEQLERERQSAHLWRKRFNDLHAQRKRDTIRMSYAKKAQKDLIKVQTELNALRSRIKEALGLKESG